MPNWCWNHLEVAGDEKQLQEFVEKSTINIKENDEFSFEGTLPRGDRKDWHEWSINNWGTKWDACESNISHNDINYFAVSFDTAWSPPINWIDNIMQDFPDLCFTLEYEEPGICFGGRLSAQYEVIWDDLHWDLDQASDCCEAEVFNIDDEEFSLPPYPLERQTRHVGEGKAFQTLEDVPEAFLYPDYQCGVCGEHCETININSNNIKPAKIKINESK
jgi:hypothetical protein